MGASKNALLNCSRCNVRIEVVRQRQTGQIAAVRTSPRVALKRVAARSSWNGRKRLLNKRTSR